MATDEMAFFTRTDGLDGGDVSDGATVHCLLCVFENDPQTMYRHLQKSHRKSELSRALLDHSR
ncbi:hypothetical protein [Haloarcula sp. JP-L23]|uniref:hypothetical protein n=1 Tax=Haloarcula sp. JP-L23 TaxID=2716717 RepID=UPI00140EC9CD|nr:hypothetical protein G9465_18075 [Haloarcula sp. JP-L23]